MHCLRCARSLSSPSPVRAESMTRGGPLQVSASGTPAARSHLLKISVTGTSCGSRARSALHLGLCAPHALLLHEVAPLAQAGGIEHVQRHAVQVNALPHHIARGTGN